MRISDWSSDVCSSDLVGKALSRYFQNEGILLHCGIENQFVKKMDKGVALGVRQSDREEPLEAERVPVATGRTPNTKGLGLAEAGVAQTRNGGIEVDERMRTTRPGTYAAGDVTGLEQFVYMAAHG